MHSPEALVTAFLEYMEKENAPLYGRTSTHMSFKKSLPIHIWMLATRNITSISGERLVSVDAKLSCLLAEVGGFLPALSF